MSQRKTHLKPTKPDLFHRVVAILERARANVVRAVNNEMAVAHWLIGREIVLELQGGSKRAEYGQAVIEDLSKKLIDKYDSGYSSPNLWNFRQFYLTYADRQPEILYPVGRESVDKKKLSPAGRELMISGHLKIGELTHQDIGQMDSYVRMFEEHERDEGHNPTIGSVELGGLEPCLVRF